MDNRTIAAISTPQGVGGIAVIRISGENAVLVASQIFSGKIKLTDAKTVTASIPLIKTDLSLSYIDRKADSLEICDGHLFSPFYTLKLNYLLGGNDKEVKSCLKLQKTKM